MYHYNVDWSVAIDTYIGTLGDRDLKMARASGMVHGQTAPSNGLRI
jgi:hypothetical protein